MWPNVYVLYRKCMVLYAPWGHPRGGYVIKVNVLYRICMVLYAPGDTLGGGYVAQVYVLYGKVWFCTPQGRK